MEVSNKLTGFPFKLICSVAEAVGSVFRTQPFVPFSFFFFFLNNFFFFFKQKETAGKHKQLVFFPIQRNKADFFRKQISIYLYFLIKQVSIPSTAKWTKSFECFLLL